MKIGMTIEPIKGMSLKQILFLLRRIGLDHLEVNATIIPRVNEFVKSIKKFTTTFHLPIYDRFYYDIGSTNELFKERIENVISFLNEQKEHMNLKYILTHPPEDSSSSNETLLNRLEQIDVPILIENIIGQTDEEFTEFYFKAKDRLGKKLAGHAVDIPHRYVTNSETWLDIPEELVKEIEYIHISDCTKNADLHLPLGMGELPYNEFFELLKKINFSGIFLQEVIPSVDQIGALMDSFMANVKPFSKSKYLNMKMKCGIIRPLLFVTVSMAYKALKRKGHGLHATDLAFDLVSH